MSERADWLSTLWLLSYLSPFSPSRALPESTDTWRDILAAADRGLVLPRLATAILASAESAPPDVSEYLAQCLELCVMRDGELRGQLMELLRRLNDRGIRPVVMKGATALLDGTRGATGRVMLDLDLGIPEAVHHPAAFAALHELGYEASGPLEVNPAHHHFPSFFLDGALSRIELHYRLASDQKDMTWDEEGACSRLVDQEFQGLRFRTLSREDAMRLSYMQCRRGCELGYVVLMKWLDFLDRWHIMNAGSISSPMDLGIASAGSDLDRQLLTALNELAKLPYRGPRDSGLLNTWRKAYTEPVPVRVFKNTFRDVLDGSRWRNKSPGDIMRAAVGRIRALRENLHRARNRDSF
jgi:hypothetical protein